MEEDKARDGMLVLGRKVQEVIKITIGDKVVQIMVIKIQEGQVRLAIKAPIEFRIDRKDFLE